MAAVTAKTSRPFVPRNEYNDLYNIAVSSDNAYQELMKKEANVLSTVNRLINDYEDKQNKPLLKRALSSTISKSFAETFSAFQDLNDNYDPNKSIVEQVYTILNKKNRTFYLGIFFCILAIFLIVLVN